MRKLTAKRNKIVFRAIAAAVLLVFALLTFYACSGGDKHPVTEAVILGDIEKLDNILKKGADPNEIANGYPALHRAFLEHAYKSTGIIELLISHGADVNARDGYGNSLMKHIICKNVKTYEQPEKIYIANILLDNGYDVNEADDNGTTLLMLASIDAKEINIKASDYNLPFQLTELFLRYNADLDAQDYMGRTALMWACAKKEWSAAGSGNDGLESPPIIRFEYKDRPAMRQILNYGLIKYLIEKGAYPLTTDANGYTPIDYYNYAKMNFNMNSEVLESFNKIDELFDYYFEATSRQRDGKIEPNQKSLR